MVYISFLRYGHMLWYAQCPKKKGQIKASSYCT